MNARLHRRANRAHLIMAAVAGRAAVVISLLAPGRDRQQLRLIQWLTQHAQLPHIHPIGRWLRRLLPLVRGDESLHRVTCACVIVEIP